MPKLPESSQPLSINPSAPQVDLTYTGSCQGTWLFSIRFVQGAKKQSHRLERKLQWCNKHLAKDTNGVTICHDKSIIYGAGLVDNFPAYIKAWLNHRPRGLVIIPVQDYNSDFIHPQVVRYDGTNIFEVRMRLSERF